MSHHTGMKDIIQWAGHLVDKILEDGGDRIGALQHQSTASSGAKSASRAEMETDRLKCSPKDRLKDHLTSRSRRHQEGHSSDTARRSSKDQPSGRNVSKQSPVTNTTDQDTQETLQAHNYARHSAPGRPRPDLIWSTELANDALTWAQHLASTKQLKHSSPNQRQNQGENLAWQSGRGKQPMKFAVEMWVDEKKYYRGEKISTKGGSGWGHYTQVIWPTTTHVGMASVSGRDGSQFFVARYSPAGNFLGRNAYDG